MRPKELETAEDVHCVAIPLYEIELELEPFDFLEPGYHNKRCIANREF